MVLIFSSCSNKETNKTEKTVEDYYKIFNERRDLERFMSFYDENIVLEDMINGDRIVGKEELRNFFDWDNPDFQSLAGDKLIVNEKIIQENKAVVKGYFTKFKWNQTEFEAMHFTTLLTFDESGAIVQQVDWINYPSTLVDYNTRSNSNQWIK
jgi:hypothetical protein